MSRPDAIRAMERWEWYQRTRDLLARFGAVVHWSLNSDWRGMYETFMLTSKHDPAWNWDWLLLQRDALEQPAVVKILVEQLIDRSRLDMPHRLELCIYYRCAGSLKYLTSLPESDRVNQKQWDELLLDAVLTGDVRLVDVLLEDGRANPVTYGDDMIDSAYTREKGPILLALIDDGRLNRLLSYDSILRDAIEDGRIRLVRFLQSRLPHSRE